MKRKLAVILCLALLLTVAAGCSEKKEETTTLTGMVMSVEGTVVNLMEMSSASGGQGNGSGQRPSGFEGGQRPEGNFTMPEGDFTMPEGGFNRPEGGFNRPEGDFTLPEGGFNRPEGDFTMPEGGFNRPEGDFTMPEGFDPDNFNGQLPEGMTRPEGGNMPNFGGNGENAQVQTTAVDLKNAHISVQDGDIKAAGSMSDIKAGSFLTITLNAKGEATEVLVGSGMSGFGGGFGNFGGFGGRGQNGKGNNQSA